MYEEIWPTLKLTRHSLVKGSVDWGFGCRGDLRKCKKGEYCPEDCTDETCCRLVFRNWFKKGWTEVQKSKKSTFWNKKKYQLCTKFINLEIHLFKAWRRQLWWILVLGKMKPTWVVKHFQNTIKRKKVQQIPDPFLLYFLFLSTILHKTSYLILDSMRLHCVSINVTPLRMLNFFHIF